MGAKIYNFKDKLSDLQRQRVQDEFHAVIAQIALDFCGTESFTISAENVELLDYMGYYVASISKDELGLYYALVDKARLQKCKRVLPRPVLRPTELSLIQGQIKNIVETIAVERPNADQMELYLNRLKDLQTKVQTSLLNEILKNVETEK